MCTYILEHARAYIAVVEHIHTEVYVYVFTRTSICMYCSKVLGPKGLLRFFVLDLGVCGFLGGSHHWGSLLID